MLLIVMREKLTTTKYSLLQLAIVESPGILFQTILISFIYLKPILISFDSSQECFKSSWSSHKSVHLKAKLGTQNSDSLGEGWLYCSKRGQGRTPKLPHFDWTG
jgi:hypothetical protein